MMEDRKEKFTPGPWHIKCGSYCRIVDANEKPIAKTEYQSIQSYSPYGQRRGIIDDGNKERMANASLIAAAPEMYAELQDLLDAMEAGLFQQAAPGVDYPAVMEKKFELRKLLKKARGEE